jgi:quinol-cytochrome oxidoreductase complex cytochrome b subunit
MACPVASVREWFDERFPLGDLKALAQKKKVPIHHYSYWYFLGGMTLFLFGVQVLTGGLLLMYYRPGADEAFESVQFIMTQVEFGWLVRSVHSWSANLLIFMAFAHLFSVLFLKSYRKPRELTWVSGILLLFLMLGFGFSGYLLPWNTLSYFATKVGTEIPAQIPIIGRPILLFMRGGEDITGSTLTRLFGLHVAIFPALATLLIGVHLALIQWFGMSVPSSSTGKEGNPLLPQLRAAGIDGVVRSARVAGRAGGIVPLGPRRESRPICFGPCRHQAGVVLPFHVPDTKADPREGPRHGRRDVGHSGIWVDRRRGTATALPRP